MKTLPKFRSKEVLTQNAGKELLIYDLTIDKAYSLNETLTVIYQACDGITTLDELKNKYLFTDDAVFLAIDELKRANLLENSKNIPLNFAGLSRREAIKRVGLASMLAIPLITGLSVPTAAQTASGRCVGAGTTLNGNLIPSGGGTDLFCSPSQAICSSAASQANTDACCSGRATIEPAAPGACPASEPQNVCRCNV